MEPRVQLRCMLLHPSCFLRWNRLIVGVASRVAGFGKLYTHGLERGLQLQVIGRGFVRLHRFLQHRLNGGRTVCYASRLNGGVAALQRKKVDLGINPADKLYMIADGSGKPPAANHRMYQEKGSWGTDRRYIQDFCNERDPGRRVSYRFC